MSDIELVITVGIIDRMELLTSAADYRCDPAASYPEKIAHVVVEPDEPPADHGYEIVSIHATTVRRKQCKIKVSINVSDEAKMVAEARKCYAGVWQDDEWKPATLGEAAFELLCASNARPGPVDLGFEFITQTYPRDRKVDPRLLVDESHDEDDDDVHSIPRVR